MQALLSRAINNWLAPAAAGLLAAIMLLISTGAVHADTTEIKDDSALQCLQRGTEPLKVTPEDIEATQGRHASYMRVKLEFRAPDHAPVVEVMANTAQGRVHVAVLKYVDQYRLPCLGQTNKGPVTATQEFHFDPVGGADSKPLHLAENSFDPMRACLVLPHRPMQIQMDRASSKKLWERGVGVAKVIVEMRFTGDAASRPEIKTLYADSSAFERSVRDHLADYSMPCRKAGDAPYAFRQTFTFAINKDLTAKFSADVMPLQQFLTSVRGIKQQKVFFDLNTMSCPFQVRWEQLRPVQSNDARSVGKYDANREEFLFWLRSLELELNAKQSRALLGESVILHVPCGQLELPPKEAS